MGKRKKAAPKPTGGKRKDALATSFKCVFCAHETSVSVKIDKKASLGSLSCKSCGQSFQSTTNYLSQPVDVYADWVDACDAVQNEEGADRPAQPSMRHQNSQAGAGTSGPEREEAPTAYDDGFIDDDGVDPEADFADD
ncbi:hypothetical protein MBLNU230_g2110t1 [Neophaeotheca triangularis]